MADVTYEKISLGRVKGDEGKSAYQSWLDSGNTGSEEDFVEWLKGDTGAKIVSTEFIGTDENGGNRYLQTFDNGVTAEFVAPKGKNGSAEIVTVDYQDLAGQQQLDRFTELTQRYLDGEIVIHLVHSTIEPRSVTSVVTQVHKFGDEIYWNSVSCSEDSDTLLTFTIGKKDGKITWSGDMLEMNGVVHNNELPDLPDKVVFSDTHKEKWCEMIGAVPTQINNDNLYRQVYILKEDGTNGIIRLANAIPYNGIPIGDNGGRIYVSEPSVDYHATNKVYVDNLPNNLTLDYEGKAKWRNMIGVSVGDGMSIDDTVLTFDLYKGHTFSLQFSDSIQATSIDWGDGTVTDGDTKSHTYYHKGLYEVRLKLTNLENLFDDTFNTKQSLVTAKIAKNNKLTSIPYETFKNCDNLETVVIPNSVTSIGEDAFSGCTSLISIDIPGSVTEIGNSSFSNCTSLTSLVIGDSVTSIGSSVLQNCSSLTSVEIGASVTSIGNSAFRNCRKLGKVTLHSSDPSNYATDMFGGQMTAYKIIVPMEALNTYKEHFPDVADRIDAYVNANGVWDDDFVRKDYVDNLPDNLTLTDEQKAKWQGMIGVCYASSVVEINNIENGSIIGELQDGLYHCTYYVLGEPSRSYDLGIYSHRRNTANTSTGPLIAFYEEATISYQLSTVGDKILLKKYKDFANTPKTQDITEGILFCRKIGL